MADLLKNISGDQKKEFNKTKHGLEDWREVILLMNSLLKWDQKYFPAITFGIVSFLFVFLWYMDLSFLTLFSLTLLVITLVDYGYPYVAKFVFKTENWTGVQEKNFEEVVHEIVYIKNEVINNYKGFFVSKCDRSSLYIIKATVGLLALAWIGAKIDNLFLCYVLSLGVTMYPGLTKHGLVSHIVNFINTHIGVHLSKLTGSHTKAE